MAGKKGAIWKDKMSSEMRLENRKLSKNKWQREHKELALEIGRKWYRSHPEHVAKKMIRNKERVVSNLKWVRDLKSKIGCTDCGEKDIRCLDFHHLDSSLKTRCVSEMMMYSIITIKKEIEKCVLLCANCHRKKTFINLI